jgi:soluble lytic murein transglycosylase
MPRLSAARIDQRFTPTLTPIARDEAEFERVAAAPGLVRTRELILCDMQSEANLEWRVALDALTAEQQTQAVRLASAWGWHLQAIAAAARLGLFNDYEFSIRDPSMTRSGAPRRR